MKIIYERLKIIIKNTLEYIDKAYENGKINIRDYDEMTTIIENINSYFLDMYGKYENIDEEVRNMVKSFYDPKVEERGIQKGMAQGIEKGIEKGKIEVARNLLKMGMDLLAIMQATGLSKEEIKKIEADMN
ncbi:MAG: Rpn family recombination-promoting nuclease/putative transposase [Clostridium cochlearium]|nr:Rpn family recombination-promoting nuclease/putative transposase [Clostridium cochlearium]MBU5269464.1 Rpn family recombination-promoting nuclease/putative transposase [Clostridium cochlearium]